MKSRNEAFGRLLRAGISSIANCEGRTTAVIEDDLGQAIGVSGDTIQRYKSGAMPSDPRTIQLLAEACITRGLMGRLWLARFLQVARYPEAATLVAQLCPTGPEPARPIHPASNLPAPPYSRFIPRAQMLADLALALQSRSATIVIVGLGGIGKTSLAHEAAARSLAGDASFPPVAAVIWISDAQRPGTTNLDLVLDMIARVLGYPGLTELAHAEKRAGVEQLLRGIKALLVVDNAETITDGALLSWLLHLPEPSKAIITTRAYLHAYRQGGWMLELRGMREEEALELAHERMHQLGFPAPADPNHIRPLLYAAGGNPKAITIALGIVKYERRTILEVVDDLRDARGEPFDDLFARTWALLDDAARRVLRVMALLPAGATLESLAAVADIPPQAIRRAVERLVDLALVDVEQADLTLPPRYASHPLVRAFAGARLAELGEECRAAQERRIQYFLQFVQLSDPDRWNDSAEFDAIEREIATLQEVLADCQQLGRWESLCEILLTLNHFWHVRSYEHLRDQYVLAAISGAQQSGDRESEVYLRCMLCRRLIDQDQIVEAEQAFAEAASVFASIVAPSPSLTDRLLVEHITLLSHQERYEQALTVAEQLVTSSQQAGVRWGVLNTYYVARSHFYLGDCLTARHMFTELIPRTDAAGYLRSAMMSWIFLARIALVSDDLPAAEQYLSLAEARARDVQHMRHLALIQRWWAEVYRRRGDVPGARRMLETAIEQFSRLGLRRDLAEARAALVALQGEQHELGGVVPEGLSETIR